MDKIHSLIFTFLLRCLLFFFRTCSDDLVFFHLFDIFLPPECAQNHKSLCITAALLYRPLSPCQTSYNKSDVTASVSIQTMTTLSVSWYQMSQSNPPPRTRHIWFQDSKTMGDVTAPTPIFYIYIVYCTSVRSRCIPQILSAMIYVPLTSIHLGTLVLRRFDLMVLARTLHSMLH